MTKSTSSRLRAERVSSFNDLKDVWDSILEDTTTASLFSSREWLENWTAHFQGHGQHHLLAILDDGSVAGIAPLISGEGIVSMAGAGPVSDFLEILARPGLESLVLETVVDYVDSIEWAQCCLGPLRPDSSTLAYLPKLASHRGWEVETQVEDVSPAVELPGDWDSYLASLKKKDRHELRRKIRRLAAAGTVNWYAYEGKQHPEEFMDFFLDLHRRSHPDKAAFMDEEMEAFFRGIATAFRGKNYLRLYFLELDGRPVASCMCFDYRDELLLYNSGYDPAYAHLSVGLVLKAFCIKDAIERGKKRFDLLRGNEKYKYDLGAKDVPLSRIVLRR